MRKKNERLKLMIWFSGTNQDKMVVEDRLPHLKNPPEDCEVVIIDGIGSEPHANEVIRTLNQDEDDTNNILNVYMSQIRQILFGYKKINHEIQQKAALKAINQFMADHPNEEFDLIIGGFSRGAAIEVPEFMNCLGSDEADKQEYRDIMKSVNNLSVLVVDPVPGNLNPDDGVNPIPSQDFEVKNIVEVLEKLRKKLKPEAALDITTIHARYDPLDALDGQSVWTGIHENTDSLREKKINLNPNIHMGLNHIATSSNAQDELYDFDLSTERRISPNMVLNEIIGDLLNGEKNNQYTQDLINLVFECEEDLLMHALFSKDIKPEILEVLTISIYFKQLFGIEKVFSQDNIIKLRQEIIKYLESDDPKESIEINGRKLGLEKALISLKNHENIQELKNLNSFLSRIKTTLSEGLKFILPSNTRQQHHQVRVHKGTGKPKKVHTGNLRSKLNRPARTRPHI